MTLHWKKLWKTTQKLKRKIKNTIKIYYVNQISNNTRLDEKIIKDSIQQTSKITDDNYKLDLIIYYKGTKMENYILKSSLSDNTILQMSYLTYKINCFVKDCKIPKPYYIGQTKNSISRTEHLQNGALKDHMWNIHKDILKNRYNLKCII